RANPQSNTEAFELWLARVQSESDTQPLEWIKQMIKNPPNERITAAGLMDEIHCHRDGHVYYNSCCNGEDESEDGSSYLGSTLGEGAGSRIGDMAAPMVIRSSQGLNAVATQRQPLSPRSPSAESKVE